MCFWEYFNEVIRYQAIFIIKYYCVTNTVMVRPIQLIIVFRISHAVAVGEGKIR